MPRKKPARRASSGAGRPLFLTPGEPAGIGPDLAIQAAGRRRGPALVVVADPELIERRARKLGRRITVETYDSQRPPRAGRMTVLPVPLARTERPGRADPANAPYVLNCLRLAVRACAAGEASALVTGPVHKGVMADAGFAFQGHTEYLAGLTRSAMPVMMLVAGPLRVALATTHLPLRKVPDAITTERLRQVLSVLDRGLKETFAIRKPRILVAGLNPHAGEQGHLGHEEIQIIEPVIRRLRRNGLRVEGPLAADTLFTPRHLARADAVLAMYHDQGLTVLKNRGFGRAVNVTLGLPIVRTSVDHGTALELAGTGKADAGSLLAAIDLASKLS